MTINILRLPAVKARTGLSRSTIYLRIKKQSFPKQVILGDRSVKERAVGWVESEIEDWVSQRIKQSRDLEK